MIPNLPAPARQILGFALLAGSVGFTGVLAFARAIGGLFR